MPRSVVRRLGFAAGLLLALPLLTRPAAAQSGSVQGQVTDSGGVAIAGAVVTVDNTSLRATTTGSGRFTLRGVPRGSQTLRVRAIGYVPATEAVEISGGGVQEQNFSLQRSPVELAPIDIVVGS